MVYSQQGGACWSFTSLWAGSIPQMELLKIFSLGQGSQGRLGPPPTIRFLNKFQMIFVLDNKTQTYYVFKNNKFNTNMCTPKVTKTNSIFFFPPLVTICRVWVINQKIWYDLPKKVLLVTYNIAF